VSERNCEGGAKPASPDDGYLRFGLICRRHSCLRFIYSPAVCAYIWNVKRYENFTDVPRNLSAEPEHHRLRAQKRK